MDDLIKWGKKKIQDLDSDALAEEINSKFKLLHIMAIESGVVYVLGRTNLGCVDDVP